MVVLFLFNRFRVYSLAAEQETYRGYAVNMHKSSVFVADVPRTLGVCSCINCSLLEPRVNSLKDNGLLRADCSLFSKGNLHGTPLPIWWYLQA